MKRARVVLCLSAVATSLGLSAACGGGDDSIPTVVVDSDGGGDVIVTPDTGFDFDAGATDSTIASDASDASSTDANDATAANDAADATGTSDANDGGTTVDGAACDGGTVSVAKLDPLFGASTAATPITISGQGFVQTPTAYLESGSTQIPLTHVAFVDSTSIIVDVPSGVAPGTYKVMVLNPNGCAALAAGSFKVLATPPPQILTVSPATGTTQTDVPVTITGCHFPLAQGAASLSTVDESGNVVAQGLTSVSCAADAGPKCADGSPLCTIVGTVQTNTSTTDAGVGLLAGAYLVRVTSTGDGAYGEYSAFTVTTPSGKLVGDWTAGASLNVGRRSLGAVAGHIDDSRRYLYAVGGENAAGVPLDSVEVAPLNRYGRAGSWFVERHHLNQARSGLALVRQGEYLYAIGGTGVTGGTGGATPSATTLDTIERARILDPAQAPMVSQPTATAGTGSLAAGTYYYRVSALMGAADADNPSGETLASDEVIVTLSANGAVSLSWQAVAGAAGYFVYRSPTATSTSGSETQLALLGAVTTYTDSTAAADAGAADAGDGGAPAKTPLPLGSTGVWKVLTQKLNSARSDTAAVVAPAPGGALHLYVVGGYGDCPGGAATSADMNCYEYAPLAANGSSLTGTFVNGLSTLAAPRMRHGLDVLTQANGPKTYTSDGGINTSAFLMVGGGYNVSSNGNTIEYAVVQADGSLGSFGSTTGFSVQRDGTQLSIVNGYAYALFGGTAPNGYKATGDISTKIGVTSTSVALGNWSNAGGSSAVALGRYGLVSDGAFFYAIGGTTTDADALTRVAQIIR